ncbi:anosmin-1 isoform X3 [Arvicanthis niloticus]|uniref:anosmin-1 isoform X3 n=1 Tax=Arvicanthis niloticus TaxID=61156 RepID=UPI00402BBAA2
MTGSDITGPGVSVWVHDVIWGSLEISRIQKWAGKTRSDVTTDYRGGGSDPLLQCQNNTRCAQCLAPCADPEEVSPRPCSSLCEASPSPECLSSCEFLQAARGQRQGACAAPGRARGFEAACVRSCEADSDCGGGRKCCGNGCGHTCQAPRALFLGVPPRPRRALRFAERLPMLEVTWSPGVSTAQEPVVFLLQARSNLGPHPSEDGASAWETAAQTALPRALLPAPRPGRWFQFRVAAVNARGSRGFTTPSRHFLSTRDPVAPLAPADLRVVGEVVHSDGSVSVEIAWAPPPEPDIPPRHFRVTWGKAMGGERRRMTVDATQHSAVLPRLHPGKYELQLQAVAFWGEKRLLGSRAELQFSAANPAPDEVTTTSNLLLPDRAITEG